MIDIFILTVSLVAAVAVYRRQLKRQEREIRSRLPYLKKKIDHD